MANKVWEGPYKRITVKHGEYEREFVDVEVRSFEQDGEERWELTGTEHKLESVKRAGQHMNETVDREVTVGFLQKHVVNADAADK